MTTTDPNRRARTAHVLGDLVIERRQQTAKHGDQTHLPDGTGPDVWLAPPATGERLTFGHLAKVLRTQTDQRSQTAGDGTVTFADILLEETFEALAETDPALLRAELVQAGAVIVQWVEAIDQRAAAAPAPPAEPAVAGPTWLEVQA